MCDLYDGDGDRCVIWDERQRTARKEHRCGTCGTTIKPGEKYVHHSSMFDGYWSRDQSCLKCNVARQRFGDEHHLTPAPSGFADALSDCIDEGPESARKWRPTLRAIHRRHPTAGALKPGGEG